MGSRPGDRAPVTVAAYRADVEVAGVHQSTGIGADDFDGEFSWAVVSITDIECSGCFIPRNPKHLRSQKWFRHGSAPTHAITADSEPISGPRRCHSYRHEAQHQQHDRKVTFQEEAPRVSLGLLSFRLLPAARVNM